MKYIKIVVSGIIEWLEYEYKKSGCIVEFIVELMIKCFWCLFLILVMLACIGCVLFFIWSHLKFFMWVGITSWLSYTHRAFISSTCKSAWNKVKEWSNPTEEKED